MFAAPEIEPIVITDTILNIAFLTFVVVFSAFSSYSFSLRAFSNFLPSTWYHLRNFSSLVYTKFRTPNIVNQIRNKAKAKHSKNIKNCIVIEILSTVLRMFLIPVILKQPTISTEEMNSSKYVSRKNLKMLWVMNSLSSFYVNHFILQQLGLKIYHKKLKPTQIRIRSKNIKIEPKFSTKLQLSQSNVAKFSDQASVLVKPKPMYFNSMKSKETIPIRKLNISSALAVKWISFNGR